ncbi:PREDICTED: uncharacterized protein LOC104779754 [Camelina sativa]|uniref:Uncharacterized protein LOC104779754 n=1 Tax=Camelina sativa TaxID=90675 RepID=A0ABM1R987_CAMSA|nr:PREDICTED: uncharacterized protein LOC104779754 [Camelina sativa]
MVLWPIPDGHDPCLISQRIESALKNSGQWRYRSGPLYITAFGNLTEIPGDDDVLRKLSSTGVALKHGHDVRTGLLEWTDVNPAPATIMLISDSKELEPLAHTLYDLEHLGYSILLAYPQRAPAPDCLWQSFLSSVSKECLWNSLLSDDDVIWGMTNRKKQDLFFRKSAVKPMNLPGLAQYAIFLDKALKISPRISRVRNIHMLSGTWRLVITMWID